MIQRTLRWLALALTLSFGLAMAQSEPSLTEVYAAAQAGKVEQAQVMMQQVLIAHPNSGKAHFVQSELYARQGNLARAKESLAKAEKLSPGLPFAKPEAVQSLRSRLTAASGNGAAANSAWSGSAAVAAPAPSSSWLLPTTVAVAVIALGFFVFRKKSPVPAYGQPAYTGSLNGPQTFGSSVGSGAVMQPPYGQAAGTGLGGKIMGGVATGLAVGAGVMAAEAIGRNLMGGHNSPSPDNLANSLGTPAPSYEMGGQDFGINNSSTWDDAGSADLGGGDWDS